MRVEAGGICLDPDVLASRYDIEFTRGIDDLDYFLAAVIRASSGRLFGLRRYRGAQPGTEVLLDPKDNPTAAREELLTMLQLSPDTLVWFEPGPSERREPRIEFLGEQDGAPERELKALLRAELLRFRSVQGAYLARIGFAPDAAISVALCIAPSSKDDRQILESVSRIFRSQFSSDAHLDVIFVDGDQEADLRQVCASFL